MTLTYIGLTSIALGFLLLFIDAWSQKPTKTKPPRHWGRLEGPK